MIPRLKEQYEKVIVNNLQKKFSMKNKLMVPKLLKIILSGWLVSAAYTTALQRRWFHTTYEVYGLALAWDKRPQTLTLFLCVMSATLTVIMER